jgi:hypothetical protein
MQRHGFYFSGGLTWRGQEFNPWSLRKPYYRLPNASYHPREPRWSFTRHMMTISVLKFTLQILRRSFPLSLAAFFFVLDGHTFLKHHHVFRFQEMFCTFLAHRRYIHYYRYTPLNRFRRYPHKVYVSSRTDPSYRAR